MTSNRKFECAGVGGLAIATPTYPGRGRRRAAMQKLIILSDDKNLSRAIAVNLQPHGQPIQLDVADKKKRLPEIEAAGLIVVALSSLASEAVVLLARAELGALIGTIPILIISERPFEDQPGESITHLRFPFTSQMLFQKVHGLLSSPPRPAAHRPVRAKPAESAG